MSRGVMSIQFDPGMDLQLSLGSEDILGMRRRDSDFTETDFMNEDLDQMERSSYTNLTNDTIFQDIRDQVDFNTRRGSLCTVHSEDSSNCEEEYGTKTSDNFTSVSFGLQPRATYEHSKKNTDIIGITYNGRMRQFIILDAKGITIWKKDLIEQNVFRTLMYPKFEYRTITNLVYAKKHNVYFALGKDFSLKVLNRDFEETCRVDSDLRSVLFMIFNPVRDELITGGVGGTKMWSYHQVSGKTWTEIKPMANYRLQLQYELPNVGGSWVKRVELDLVKQHLYCCSDTDLFAYNMDGQEVFRFERAHNMSITGCAFSTESNLLVTASVDTEVKAWSLGGGLVHTFRGHSRAISSLILHPGTSSIVLTSSLDGSVRLWSLDTMECLYSMVVSSDGLLWMGLTDDNLLYLGTMRAISVWSLNRFTTFWAATRSQLSEMKLVSGEGKSTRVLAVCQDNSLRIFCRKTCKNLSTVLPPPSLSPLDNLIDVAYNRMVNIVHVLVNTREILLYTVRTDPACMVTVWDTMEVQTEIIRNEQEIAGESSSQKRNNISNFNKRALTRATQYGQGNEMICQCHSICYLNAYVMMYTEEGPCTPLQDNYLLMGLEDGRILFMDPVVKAKKYFQFRANKEAIIHMKHDKEHGCLWTQCHLGDAVLIQIWLLPQLELRHEVYCPPDITGCVRLGTSFVTSHKSGAVIHHHLQEIDDMAVSVYRPRFCINDVSSQSSFTAAGKTDHNGPVFSIDACHRLGLFCTASEDGMVKIWESTKTLLTEITLDKTLCAAVFLNSHGDLLIGFKNHIFHIDHSKVCPSVKIGDDLEEDYPESDIQEDPAILYEGVAENPDPLDLNNYLVPFNIDFCQDYLEGKTKTDKKEEEPSEESCDDSTSVGSAAATVTYQSPYDTPQSLSLLDLTLSNQVTDQDIREHAAHTQPKLDDLREKIGLMLGDDYKCADENRKQKKALDFDLPKFGISPGPTPTPSPPSSIATPSNFEVSSGGESTPVDSEEEAEHATAFKPIEPSSDNTPPERVLVPKPSVAQQTDLSQSSRFGNIRIDSKSLFKESHKAAAGRPESGLDQMKTAPETTTQPKPRPPARELKRRQTAASRKRPPTRRSTDVKQVSAESDEESEDSATDREKAKTTAPRAPPSLKKRSKVNTPRSDEVKRASNRKSGEVRKPSAESGRRSAGSSASQVISSGTERTTASSRQPSRNDDIKTQEVSSPAKTVLGLAVVTAPAEEFVSKLSASSDQRKKSVISTACAHFIDSGESGTKAAKAKAEIADIQHQKIGSVSCPEAGGRPQSTSTAARPETVNSSHVTDPYITSTGVDDLQRDDVLDRPKSILKCRNSPPTVLDKSGTSLSQLKVGFHNDLQSDVLSDGLQTTTKSTISDPKQDPGSGVPGEHRRHPSSAKESITKQSIHSDGMTSGTEHLSTAGESQARSQQDRTGSPSTTIISDYGSEWTLAADDKIRIDDTMGMDIPGWHRATMSAISTRRHTPATALTHPRPHTALVLPADKQELEKMYQKALQQYEAEGNPDQIYRNDGTTFEKYHDKLIERHQLLRMQRQLRLKSAEQRRRQMSLEKQERNEMILHRSGSSLGRGKPSPDSAFALYDRSASSSPVHMPKVPTVYISTRQVEPTPKLSPLPASHSNQYCSFHKEQMRGESPSTYSASTVGNVESPRTAQKVMKSLLKSERPFRARLHPQKSIAPEKKSAEKVDIRLLDPRNPAVVKQHSSKSIPSKCTRYVLVTNTKDEANKIIPTPLEEQLIMERFPDRMEKWLTGYPRSPRMYHGFPSSYLKAMALDRKALLQSIASADHNKAC